MLDRLLRRSRRDAAAAVAQVRALLAGGKRAEAQSLAESLRRNDAALGHLAAGIAAFDGGFVELARAELLHAPRDDRFRLAAAAYVRSGLALAPDETLAEVRRLVADDPPGVGAESWYELLAAVFGHGDQELARAVFEVFDRRVGADSPLRLQRDTLRPWVAADADSPTAAPPDGRRTVAIMDYGHPGASRASANIGDHIQSIAALGHLVRHRGVRLHGPPELTGLLAQLGERTRPELRADDIAADVEVMTVHRDASMYQPIPADSWVLCFGWYMHALFELRHGFPLHRNLLPIFVSFHCNKRSLLTPDAIDYLTRYGPVGCRDWTTVHLLLSCGVPAFFSGCVTTTISTLFPPAADPPPDAPLAYVDMPEDEVPAGAVVYRHSDPAVRRRSFVTNAGNALALLERYRSAHAGVVTSRLHCYLPLRSIGVDVEFRPHNPADVRFDGLIGIGDAEFDAIRAGLLAKLEQVHRAILGGRPEGDVYALWRGLCAADVAAAERRRERPLELPHGPPGVGAAAERRRERPLELPPGPPGVADRLRRAAARTIAPADPLAGAVQCAVVVGKGDGLALSVLVASLLEHASAPLQVWLLGRPGAGGIRQRLAARFPRVGFGWVPVRGLGRVVRLVLADLLPDTVRVVLLPLPAVATGDIAELARIDLGGRAFAAPRRPGTVRVSGFGVIHSAAARLRDRTEAAAELRRTAHARHRFDFDAFTGDVLVVDLERLRDERFSAAALPLAAAFGLRELEVLHYLAGPDRATVAERWATVPTRSPVRGDGLIYWADAVKPWERRLTPEREHWRRYAEAYRPRQARPAP